MYHETQRKHVHIAIELSAIRLHFVVKCSYCKAQRDSFIRNSYELMGYENACFIFSKSTKNVYSALLGSSYDLVQNNVYKRFLAESFLFVYNSKDYVNTYHFFALMNST